MPASLRPLRHRNYALVWGSGMVSNTGSWMQTVAVGAFVTADTGQAAWAGLVALAAFLPMGVLPPIGGALADRLDRRKFLMAANTAEGVIAGSLALLVAAGHATPGQVTAIVFLGGCLGALRLPFLQAMTPDLVPRDELILAASLNSAQWNLGRVVGPSLAGVVIALWGFEWALAVNAVSFGAVIVAMALVRLHQELVPPTAGLVHQIVEGARAARAEPGCRSAIGLMALTAFLAAPFIALIPARALELTDGSDAAVARVTGLLTTAQGIGAVIGAFIVAELAHRYGRRGLLVFDLFATPVALLAYAWAPSVPTAFAALLLVGGVYIGILAGCNTTVQLRAPAHLRGRVLSIYLVSLGGVYPIGGLVQGFLADRVGLALVTTVTAVAMVAVLSAVAAWRPRVYEVLGDPEPEEMTLGSDVEVEEPVGLVAEGEPGIP